MFRDDIPHLKQKRLIIIAYSYPFRRHSRRTHHHIKAFADHIFRHRHENLVEIFSETGLRESFMSLITHRLLIRIVAPVRVHMHSDEIHLPADRQHRVYHALVIVQTCCHVIIVPAPVVEERAVSLAETMKIHNVSVIVLEITADYIKFEDRIVRNRIRIGFRLRLRIHLVRRSRRNPFRMFKARCRHHGKSKACKNSEKVFHGYNYFILNPSAKPAYAYLRL